MDRTLELLDRFRTPLTVVTLGAILAGSGVLAARALTLQSSIPPSASAEEEALIADLKVQQAALAAELAKLKALDTADSISASATPVSRTPGTVAGTTTTTSLIHLNQADRATLETLPGIGASKAQAILDYRTAHGRFTSIDELDNVKGIGAATVAKLRPYLTLD